MQCAQTTGHHNQYVVSHLVSPGFCSMVKRVCDQISVEVVEQSVAHPLKREDRDPATGMNTAGKYHHKSKAASNCQLSRQSHGVIPGHQRGIPLLDARAAPAGNSPARRRDRQVETRHQRGIPLLDAETRRTNTNAMCTTTGHHNQYVVSHLVSSLIPQSVFSSQAARKEKVSVIEMRSSLASVHIC